MMQLIFLFETTSSSKSDYKYVKKYLDSIGANRKYKYSPLYMKSKMNYNKMEKNIERLKKLYNGKSIVFYFIDVDSIETNQDDIDLNEKIKAYTKSKGYKLIWFKHTIEEVFLGHTVSDNEKNQAADDYYKKRDLINYDSLNISEYDDLKKGQSNLKYILDKYIKI